MRLLVDNAEVRSQRVAMPSPSAFEAVCQLVGIPFRHDKTSGVLAVYPPLIGRRLLVRFVDDDTGKGDHLQELLKTELKLLERLLWITGADITLEKADGPQKLEGKKDARSTYWDTALFIYTGLVVPGGIDPLVIYPWWERPFGSFRLAGHLALASECASPPGFRRTSSLKLPSAMKEWFSESRRGVSAPTVLLAIPLIHGYNEPLLENLSVTVCNGVLGYFKKTPIDASIKEAFRPEILESKGTKVQGDVPANTDEPVIGTAGTAFPQQAKGSVAGVGILDAPQPVAPVKPSLPGYHGGIEDFAQDVLRQKPRRHVESPPQIEKVRGDMKGPMPPRETLPHGKEEETSAINNRDLLSKPVDEARRLVYKFLSSQGIKPTEELVDEYLLYLERIGKAPDQSDSK